MASGLDCINVLQTDCMERQDLSCTYLAHHELDSELIIIIIVVIVVINMLQGR